MRLALLATLALLLAPSAARADFGFPPGGAGFDFAAEEQNGAVAGDRSHPYTLTATINFNSSGEPSEVPGVDFSDGDVRDLSLEYPAGLIENPAVVGSCSIAQFRTPRVSPFQASASGESCPLRSQIGLLTVRGAFAGGSRTFGLFNLAPPPGFPSMIGASPFGSPIVFSPRIRSAAGEFGISLRAVDIPQQLDISGLTITIWGNPWLVGHDLQRGNCLNEVNPDDGFGQGAVLEEEPPLLPPPGYEEGTCSTGNPKSFRPYAYLTLPSSCGQALGVSVSATSWQSSSAVTRSRPLNLTECEPNAFNTTALVVPTTDRAASPSGLDFNLDPDQNALFDNVTERGHLIAGVRAPSQVKKAVVVLPEGMTINPSVAAGLGVCAPAQYEAETVSSPPGSGCPNASRIGEVSVVSPLFETAIEGGLFLAKPYENPFGTLLALYLVAKSPQRGAIVKLAGRVDADPASGQLTATFDNLPQLPYSHLDVHFRDSQRSPLATPPACGVYSTLIDLSPWVDPALVLHRPALFQLSSGIAGGACPSAAPPFAPQADGGTLNRNAGSYSPFYLHLTRSDADQEITSYSVQLPPGLLGKLAGVPFCPEAALAAAAASGGLAEAERPACPAGSKIGHTTAGYGMGAVLAYAPGGLYLAGPYHGSPLSVVAVDSATVGPFDLGTIIVRSAIRVDPRTGQVSIDSAGSDPIPHIIKGIPLHLRDIRVYIDRPGFMVNPTSCERFALTSTLNGAGAVFSNAADDTAAAVAHPFQVSFCSSLKFAPRMRLRLKGGTERADYPALKATVAPRPGNANIGRVSVVLPPSEFLAQEHIETICGRGQSAAGRCPKESIYGTARARTPLLDEPLEGPVYLRASDGKLPDLVAALSGRGVRIDVVGRIDSRKGGMRATFDVLPDAPVSKFVMNLRGGARGLLVNSDDVCTAPPATVRMVGQNNRGVVLRPKLVNPKCRKGSRG
jgi:hypothetical protein